MNMSTAFGDANSSARVTRVSKHGLCLWANGRKLFLPYDDFPWFKGAPMSAVLNIQEPTPGHFYWPDLDVDLGLETITHSERFPLKFEWRFARGRHRSPRLVRIPTKFLSELRQRFLNTRPGTQAPRSCGRA